jgi:glucan biosynthesis protein C
MIIQRRHDIDWLRLLAVFFLFSFHTARVFDTYEINYVQNAEPSAGITALFVHGFNPWHMQLFFTLAGMSSFFALRFRSGKEYLRERFRRLLIPFIFGVLVIVPPQVYYAERLHNGFSGSYLDFYPSFFRINPADLSGYTGGWTPAHLWFILFLYVLSLLALPLFLHFKGEIGKPRLASFALALQKPGLIFLLGIPLALSLLLPDLGGKNPFYYLLFILFGYIFAAEERFDPILQQNRKSALIIGLGSVVLFVARLYWRIELPSERALMLVDGFIFSVGSLACVIALLGYVLERLKFSNRFLQYFAPAAYPIYILHQTIIMVVAFYVVSWQCSPWAKFVLIVGISFVVTMSIYDMLVRRNNITRFLFGMKPLRR